MNFIAIIDPCLNRRTEFLDLAEKRISHLPNLLVERREHDNIGIVWARGYQSPIQCYQTKNNICVLWGRAIDKNGYILSPKRLTEIWRATNSATFDGYFVCFLSELDRIKVGTDVLGYFPVYYTNFGDVSLVGASAELFRYHPEFNIRQNPVGLVDTLLLNGNFGEQCLLAGVKRLKPGFMLSLDPEPREEVQYQLPRSDEISSDSFDSFVEQLHDVVLDAIARHTKGVEHLGLLLTGGRDSRLIAAFLKKLGKDVTAFTVGWENDIEVQCAQWVAEELNLNHLRIEPRFDRFPSFLADTVSWQHLSNGLSCELGYALQRNGEKFPPFLVSGFSLDSIIGGSVHYSAFSEEDACYSFDVFFDSINRWGIRPGMLKQLLNSELAGLVEPEIEKIKTVFHGSSNDTFHLAWCFHLYNRQRRHVGFNAWALSFVSWPILPAIDRSVIEFGSSVPAEVIRGRRLQDAVLCRYFPELAAIPVDRNSSYTHPLMKRGRDPYEIKVDIGKEQRTFYKLMDINSRGWKQVRELAQKAIPSVSKYLTCESMDALLSDPSQDMLFDDAIIDSAGIKLLIGFILWCDSHENIEILMAR